MNKIDTKMLKAGDEIYVARFTGHDMSYTPAKVVKVTPAGLVDVAIGSQETTTRFRADGKLQGGDRYRDYELDSIPFAERKAYLAREGRLRQAAYAVSAIKAEGGVNARWGTDGLIDELKRLQDLLDAARAKVEEVQ
jgi:hypothetical protein